MNKPAITIKEIAALAGCSARVVATVLNPGNSTTRVGEATRQRILATAREMGYRPNQLARAVATGKSRVLGVIIENQGLEHMAYMLAGAIEAASHHNYLVKVLPLPQRVSSSEPIEKCLEWRMAGLLAINLPAEVNDFLRAQTQALQIPLVLLDNVGFYDDCVSVISDDEQGVRLVIEHLRQLGHRDIAFLGGTPETPASQAREANFRAIMQQNGLTTRENWVLQSDWGHQPIIEAAAHSLLHDNEDRPTAVMCAGDGIAMVTMRVARRLGLHLPTQLSVVGFANFYLSRFGDPALTTVEQPFAAMGRVATERLIAISEGTAHDAMPRHELLPTRLVQRHSTAPPPSSA